MSICGILQIENWTDVQKPTKKIETSYWNSKKFKYKNVKGTAYNNIIRYII